MSLGKFSVVQFFAFPTGANETVLSCVDAEEAVKGAHSLSQSVGAQVGTTERIIITDGDDSTVFEWVHGIGVIFPPKQA